MSPFVPLEGVEEELAEPDAGSSSTPAGPD
jgi:hypothetical protein